MYLSVKYLVVKHNEANNSNIGILPLKINAAEIRANASAYLKGNLNIGAVHIFLAYL